GDKERKIASKTSYLINQIFEVHPLMKLHTIREIEQLILFPTANERSLYYDIVDSKLVAAILTGVNRAYKFAKVDHSVYFINQPEDHDGDEHFVDVPDDDSDNLDRSDDDEPKKIQVSSQTANPRTYDGRKRDPQYSNADQTFALYAKQLLENISIDPPPELHHHTLSHFLDRFVYRNPKKTDRIKGGNPLLQPTVASEPGMVVMKKGTGISKDEINVNSEEFWRKKLDDVPEDQVNEIWAAMKSTMPIKMDSDFENSDDDNDLEESYFSSEDEDEDDVGNKTSVFLFLDGPAHKKIKLKHLPTFASYEDIASLVNKKNRKRFRKN
ncbi:20008_t:CDS:2, partial [Racocetra fulgida]